jgi:hypothetical protein
MGPGPFAHCRRVQGTAAAAPSLRRRRPIGGLRGRAGSPGSTTPSEPPTRAGQLIEMGLAQVEFVAGAAVVHSNRRHGLGAVTVKIADKHDPCCLGHDSSLQRHTSDEPLVAIQTATIYPAPSPRLTNQPRRRSRRGPQPGSSRSRVDAPLDAVGRHRALDASVTNPNGASSRDQASATLWVTTTTGTLRDLTP